MAESPGLEAAGEGPTNRRVALLIAILALFLALAETLAKSSQTNALTSNVEASDLWNFYQAKTIRESTVKTIQEALPLIMPNDSDPSRAAAVAKQMDAWNTTNARWDSDPKTREGRKELMERAQEAEAVRDISMSKYHQFEYGSAALQIGIVLASAAVITDVLLLAAAGGILGLIGTAFIGLGLFAPHLIHFGH